MDGAQCQHEPSRIRRKRRPAKAGEIAVAVGVMLVGVAVIVAIVLVDPRWQRIFGSWRDGFAGVPRSSPEAIPSSQPVPVRPVRAEPMPPAASTGTSTAYGMTGTQYNADAEGVFIVAASDVGPLLAAGWIESKAEVVFSR